VAPLWVIGIGGVPDFDVPFDRHTCHIEQIYQVGLIVPSLDLPKKHPIPAAHRVEILLLCPLS
jgi:hypothetical protein